MLSQRYSISDLSAHLVDREKWHPYPRLHDRQEWESLSSQLRRAHIRRAQGHSDRPWEVLPATRFLDYARDGNRTRYQDLQNPRRAELRDLVVAECVVNEGALLDPIANAVWAICEESFWGVPAHLAAQKAGVGLPDPEEPIVDLFAGETAALLAWTSYLVGEGLDEISPMVRKRIAWEVRHRLLDPCLERDDFWWMGFSDRRVNNWNPWCNSNWLTCALLLETDADARTRAVHKILRSLDAFLDDYPADGGCDEGPGYWGRAGASLFDCLELLRGATDGYIDVYNEPLIHNMGRYIMGVFIDNDYFINFADASAMVSPPATLVYRWGCRIGDREMKRFGAALAERQDLGERGVSDSLGRVLPGLFVAAELLDEEAEVPRPRTIWMNAIEVMAAREREGSVHGLFLAAKGGHNEESHNHNDVGSFVVYTHGRPLIVDAGVEAYTAKTFSDRRYEIWTMQSSYHNLPTVGGVQQAQGREFASRNVRYAALEGGSRLELDIAGAYPREAGMASWNRSIELAGDRVTVRDAYVLERAAGRIEWNLMTPCDAEVDGSTIRFLARELDEGRRTGEGRVEIESAGIEVRVETIAVPDPRMCKVWGGELRRVVILWSDPPQTGELVTSIVADG